MTMTNAREEMQELLNKLDNKGLADALEAAINPTAATQDLAAPAFWIIRNEADKRAGHIAGPIYDAELDKFNKKHGITDTMTGEEMEKIYDQVPESEFPRGYNLVLIDALRSM